MDVHGVHRTLKTVLVLPRSVMSLQIPYACENAEAEADEGSLAFGFREPFSKAARTVRIEVKSGLSKEILEDLLRIQTALE